MHIWIATGRKGVFEIMLEGIIEHTILARTPYFATRPV